VKLKTPIFRDCFTFYTTKWKVSGWGVILVSLKSPFGHFLNSCTIFEVISISRTVFSQIDKHCEKRALVRRVTEVGH